MGGENSLGTGSEDQRNLQLFKNSQKSGGLLKAISGTGGVVDKGVTYKGGGKAWLMHHASGGRTRNGNPGHVRRHQGKLD